MYLHSSIEQRIDDEKDREKYNITRQLRNKELRVMKKSMCRLDYKEQDRGGIYMVRRMRNKGFPAEYTREYREEANGKPRDKWRLKGVG